MSRGDTNHRWASTCSERFPPPWITCESALSESFHLLEGHGDRALAALLQRRALVSTFDLSQNIERVLELMEKYSDTPMSLADACLVRMTETTDDPVLLTTDADFRVYRRHSRQAIPCVMPR